MRQRVADKLNDVTVSKCVINMFSAAFANDDVFRSQDTKPLRDGRERFLLQLGQVSNAQLATEQSRE